MTLAHVINLGVTDVMAMITKIATVETTAAIWEYDLYGKPDNHAQEFLRPTSSTSKNGRVTCLSDIRPLEDTRHCR